MSNKPKLSNAEYTVLPDTVKIFHRDYTLRQYTDVEKIRLGVMGDFRHIEGELTYANVSPSETVDTVLHEIMHALWYYFNHDKEIEEHIIETMATGLATVMRDNPKLFSKLEALIATEGKAIDK